MTNQQKDAPPSAGDCRIDKLDREILRRLVKDARTPFLEIARELGVAGGTIHQRVDRLRELGVIRGSRFVLAPEKLGLGVMALVGVHLNRAQDSAGFIRQIQKLPAVIEAHYTTGSYSLILKVVCRDMSDYHDFLSRKLQAIASVRATESFLCMATPISRDWEPN